MTTMPDGCTCECVHPGDYQTPPEWEQDPDCPVHPMTKAPRHIVGLTEIPLNLVGPWMRVASLLYPGSTVSTPQGTGLAMQLNLYDADYGILDALNEALTELESR